MPSESYSTGEPQNAADREGLSDTATRAEMTPSAVQAMTELELRWKLTSGEVSQLIGGVAVSMWDSWKQYPPDALTAEQLSRISLLLGIFAALHVLHDDQLADQWVRRPNTNELFGGSTPLDSMIEGGVTTMLQVRALLDSRRAGQ